MADKYRNSLLILSTKRCPYRCRFCAYHMDKKHILSKRPTVLQLANETKNFFEKKIKSIKKNKEIYIVNSGSFLDERQIPKGYIYWLANFLKDKDLSLALDCRADSRVNDYIDEIKMLNRIVNSLTFSIGVEAYREDIGDSIFKKLRKGISKEQCIRQAVYLHNLGCKVKVYVIIALPWLDGPSYLKEGYRKNMDWQIETAFKTVKFAIEEMRADRIGLSPFFPYRGTNSAVPDDWVPISAIESYEIRNQLGQIFPNIQIDFTSRQIHFAFGNFFRNRGLSKPINTDDYTEVLKARENVARICKKVFGVRGEINRKFYKNNK